MIPDPQVKPPFADVAAAEEVVGPPEWSGSTLIPKPWVQEKPSVPFEERDSPTTVVPSAEMPLAVDWMSPPASSPRPLKIAWGLAPSRPSANEQVRNENNSLNFMGDFERISMVVMGWNIAVHSGAVTLEYDPLVNGTPPRISSV
jgi:hypothetical protein